jgi:hypothetical protein
LAQRGLLTPQVGQELAVVGRHAPGTMSPSRTGTSSLLRGEGDFGSGGGCWDLTFSARHPAQGEGGVEGSVHGDRTNGSHFSLGFHPAESSPGETERILRLRLSASLRMTEFSFKHSLKSVILSEVEGSAPGESRSGEIAFNLRGGSLPGADPSTSPVGFAQDDGVLI